MIPFLKITKMEYTNHKDGKAYVHYKRDFLPETTYPRVNAKSMEMVLNKSGIHFTVLLIVR